LLGGCVKDADQVNLCYCEVVHISISFPLDLLILGVCAELFARFLACRAQTAYPLCLTVYFPHNCFDFGFGKRNLVFLQRSCGLGNILSELLRVASLRTSLQRYLVSFEIDCFYLVWLFSILIPTRRDIVSSL
jgi:hypothetical protein